METEDTHIRQDEERTAWLTLKLMPGLGNRSLLRLYRHFKSPAAILRATARDLAAVSGLTLRALSALERKDIIRSPEAEWETMKREGITLVCMDDPDYPSNLAAIPDPPVALLVRGSLEPRDLVAVAVVGSRAASPLGMAFTERLCTDLAQSGVTIVSGLAIGIDSAAHRGALRGKGRTFAVLGCGLDIDYPRSNSELRQGISESGALMTELPLGAPPAPGHFPLRNRIISGLALGVVVVEAANRSGSLITARLALEQGREVFAVPGMAQNYRSTGPHRLLREGARLVENAEDILEEIRPLIRAGRPGASPGKPRGAPVGAAPHAFRPGVQLTAEEGALLAAMDRGPIHIDEICRSLGWPVSQVMALLLTLELKGIVKQSPGKYFARVR